MRVFFDTSVLVAAVLEGHPAHAPALAALRRVHSGGDQGAVSSHSLAEFYAILTKLPAPFRHSPEQALLSLEENVVRYFKTISLTGGDYAAVLREAATAGIQGGTVCDAVLLRTASKAGVERVYTLNLKHFQAVAPASLAPLLSLP
jgi:predicted nucleic acid-binding protein